MRNWNKRNGKCLLPRIFRNSPCYPILNEHWVAAIQPVLFWEKQLERRKKQVKKFHFKVQLKIFRVHSIHETPPFFRRCSKSHGWEKIVDECNLKHICLRKSRVFHCQASPFIRHNFWIIQSSMLSSLLLTSLFTFQPHVCKAIWGIKRSELPAKFLVAYTWSPPHDACFERIGQILSHDTCYSQL